MSAVASHGLHLMCGLHPICELHLMCRLHLIILCELHLMCRLHLIILCELHLMCGLSCGSHMHSDWDRGSVIQLLSTATIWCM